MPDLRELYSSLLKEPYYDEDLNINGDDDEPQSQIRHSRAPLKPLKLHIIFLILHIVLLAVLATLVFQSHDLEKFGSKSKWPHEWLIHSPANVAVSWETTQFENDDVSKYIGKPSPEIDQAWSDLLQHTNIRISDKDLKALHRENEANVALPDGGYAALLNVFHELHCLKRLYQYAWPDYYFPDFTTEQHELNRQHQLHCINQLRQGVTCHSDTQLATYRWASFSRVPIVNDTAPHQCVNFKHVYDFAAEHSIDKMFDPGYLIHPTLGEAYPDRQGSRIGVVIPPKDA